jgi:hypothetical protein
MMSWKKYFKLNKDFIENHYGIDAKKRMKKLH